MAQAVNAIQMGFDYQARLFWLSACKLLASQPRVCRVGYEVKDVNGFDDIVVDYAPPIKDGALECRREFHQVKFHVNPTHSVTATDFTDPEFLGTERTTLLQRLHSLLCECHKAGVPFTAHFWTTAPITPTDPLARLVSNETNAIDLDKLVQAGARSKIGVLREQWRDHLKLKNAQELRDVLGPLRLHHGSGSLNLLGNTLGSVLESVGLTPPSPDSPANVYDDLVRKLRRQGDGYFTAQQLRDACRAAGLCQTPSSQPKYVRKIGIRSFRPWADFLDEETDKLLNFLEGFDGRAPRNPNEWPQVVAGVRDFLEASVIQREPNCLFLCAHQTIAFAAGYTLPVKAGVNVSINQSTQEGRQIWDVSTTSADANVQVDAAGLGTGQDIVLAVSATHDVRGDVLKYVQAHVSGAGILVHLHPQSNPSSASIKDGAEAVAWCNEAGKALMEAREEFKGTIHVFAASPNALLFALGRNAHNWGRIQLYEFTFNDADQRTYTPSAVLPLA